MKDLTINAIRVNQIDKSINDKKDIYISTIKVRDLINEAQFQIDYWSPAKKESENQGYQRHPFPSHYRKIGKYALSQGAIFPGAVIISCRSTSGSVAIFHDKGNDIGELELQHPPLWIVDGQHRIMGLKYSIEEEGETKWLDREMPVIILANFSRMEEVEQFKTLNSTSKKVSTDLAQQLMLFRATHDKDYRKSLKLEGEDWKVRCLKLIEKLNESEESPWFGRIKGPNPTKTVRLIVGQNSLLVSLKPLFTNGYFESTRSIDHEYEILKNYWDALKTIFPHSFQDPNESVILKTAGIFSLHSLLKAILQRTGGSNEKISKQYFTTLLEKVFEEAGEESGEKMDDYFWSSDNDSGASLYGSMKGFRILADKFIEGLELAIKN